MRLLKVCHLLGFVFFQIPKLGILSCGEFDVQGCATLLRYDYRRGPKDLPRLLECGVSGALVVDLRLGSTSFR